jgi:hypothetical protein
MTAVGTARAATTPAASSAGADADLFSCDIFDTLITRVVGKPSSLFLLLGRFSWLQA